MNKQDDYGERVLVSASLLTGNYYEGYGKCIPPLIEAGTNGNIAKHGGQMALLSVYLKQPDINLSNY